MKTILNYWTHYLIALGIFVTINSEGQTFQWAKRIGSGGIDNGLGIKVDINGNVYTVGTFRGTVDFDPGVGVFNLVSSGTDDIFISKIDASGNFVWAKSIGGVYSDNGLGIVLDVSGGVYTTGNFAGTLDFDPGPGTFTMSASAFDCFILKLDANGNFVWAKQIGGVGSSNECGYAITIDTNSNIYTTGYFQGFGDFDPGVGTYTLSALLGHDVFISKLDPSGNFVWAKQFGGFNDEFGNSISVDITGNVYTTGYFLGNVDFDPGAGSFNLASNGLDDVFISKLDPSGNFIWAKKLGSTGSDRSYDITLDGSSGVYTTGYFGGTLDFDPGAGTFTMTPVGVGTYPAFISKLDASGNFVWAKKFDGATTSNVGYSIDIDGLGNVCTTGQFSGTTDFDPAAGTYTLSAAGNYDIFIHKLDASGNFLWAGQMGGPASVNVGQAIAVDLNYGIYVTGYFTSTADFDAGPGFFNMTSWGTTDIFIVKYPVCSVAPSQPLAISGPNTVCVGVGPITYSVPLVSGATSYSWNLPATWSGSSSANTIAATPGASGIFSVTANNPCGVSAQQTLNITVNIQPTISVNSGSICAGQSFTIVPTGANAYIFQGGSAIVSPTATTSYSVTGTSTAGCISASPAISSITVNSLPTISVNSGSVCVGNSFTIVPTGANTYTFQGGSAIVSPTSNATYTVSGTSTAGCVSASPAISSITVNALPTISVNSGSICMGNSFTIVPTGANTYTFQGGSAIVSPTSNATYTVSGTSTAGCASAGSATSNITVNALPTIGASTTNSLLCISQSATLTASGASIYTFNPGGAGISIAVSPTVTTTYTITGTDANGCVNTTVFTQSVSACTEINFFSLGERSGVRLFPNPVNEILHIEFEANNNQKIEIINVLSEVVLSETATTQHATLSIQHFSTGIYFVKIGTITKKIIKN